MILDCNITKCEKSEGVGQNTLTLKTREGSNKRRKTDRLREDVTKHLQYARIRVYYITFTFSHLADAYNPFS